MTTALPASRFRGIPRTLAILAWLAALHGAAFAAEPTVEFTVSEGDSAARLSASMLIGPAAWREVSTLNRLVPYERIRPGQVLQIPVRLLRTNKVDARLISISGEVRVDGRPATLQDKLIEGQAVETGPLGSAVVELADTSRVKVAPSSLVAVLASRRLAFPDVTDSTSSPSTGLFSGALRLLRGSVEVLAAKVRRATPLEVTTPTAVVGVRGTEYRVAFDDGADRATRAGVLEGHVQFDSSALTVGAPVPSGFGAAVDVKTPAPSVVKLAAAPDLSPMPALFERPVVQFRLPGEALALHVQVASDAGFDRIVRDQRVEPGEAVSIAGLDDGPWFLRARRFGELQIEGLDASRPFVLNARPEPPPLLTPRAGAKFSVGDLEFGWTPNPQAGNYRVQIARGADFSNLLVDRGAVAGEPLRLAVNVPGTYSWRVASLRADARQGPFGDPSTFDVRAAPAAPAGRLTQDRKAVQFTWADRPGSRHRVELARDAGFRAIIASAEVSGNEWSVPLPDGGGDFYFRYRVIEPDGFVSANSATLKVQIRRDRDIPELLFPSVFISRIAR